jgi:hypothetical protein
MDRRKDARDSDERRGKYESVKFFDCKAREGKDET